MKELIDTYKKKLKVAQNLLEEMNKPEDKEARIRIVAKVSSYSNFIFELEKFMETSSKELNKLNLDIIHKEDKAVCKHDPSIGNCSGMNPIDCVSCGKLVLYGN